MTLYRLVGDGSAAVPVQVRFGSASDQYIQLVGGLEPGDRVIVSDTSGFAGEPRVAVR
jgi:multidrug efflux pump subunit AcrA (membrane-fusion protein)